jgi:hypothetical protein
VRRGLTVTAATAAAAVVLAACSGTPRQSAPSKNDADQGPSGRTAALSRTSPTLPTPSPTAQAWGSCGNIRGQTDARDLVAAGDAKALVEARVTGTVVKSYRVLAGQVSGLRTLNDGLTAPPGRYILLLGGTSAHYYAALGYYGVYRVLGKHAYQMCAYGGPEVTRSGVTDLDRIVELLRQALGE